MTFNDLSIEEKELILKNRLDKLNLNITTGSCKVTGTILTKDSNKIALAINDEYADKQILLTLSDNQIDDLYNFLRTRHSMCKQLLQLEDKVNCIPEKNNGKRKSII